MFAYLSLFMRWVFAQGMHCVRFVIDSYCSAHPTGALRLSCAVPWQVRNMCFSSFFFSSSFHTCSWMKNGTWWKSSKGVKRTRAENEKAWRKSGKWIHKHCDQAECHRYFREFTKCFDRSQSQNLASSSPSVTACKALLDLIWDRKLHKSSVSNYALCKLKWGKRNTVVWCDWVELPLTRHIL